MKPRNFLSIVLVLLFSITGNQLIAQSKSKIVRGGWGVVLDFLGHVPIPKPKPKVNYSAYSKYLDDEGFVKYMYGEHCNRKCAEISIYRQPIHAISERYDNYLRELQRQDDWKNRPRPNPISWTLDLSHPPIYVSQKDIDNAIEFNTGALRDFRFINETGITELWPYGYLDKYTATKNSIIAEAKKLESKYNVELDPSVDFPLNLQKLYFDIAYKHLLVLSLIGENPNNLNLKGAIRDFVELHDLTDLFTKNGVYSRKNVVFDENIQRILEEEIIEIEEHLNTVIFSAEKMSLESKIALYHEIKGLEHTTAFKDIKYWPEYFVASKDFQESLKKDIKDNVCFIRNNYDDKYEVYVFDEISIYGNNEDLISKRPAIRVSKRANVLIELNESTPDVLNAFNKNVNREYELDEITIMPLVDNTTTIAAFENANVEWIDIKLSQRKIRKALRSKKNEGKTIFVIGHVIDGAYCNTDDKFIIGMEELLDLAKENKINVVNIACSTAKDLSAGTNREINTAMAVKELINSCTKTRSFREMIFDYSTKIISSDGKNFQLVVDANSFVDQGYMRFKLYKRAALAGGSVVIATLIIKSDN